VLPESASHMSMRAAFPGFRIQGISSSTLLRLFQPRRNSDMSIASTQVKARQMQACPQRSGGLGFASRCCYPPQSPYSGPQRAKQLLKLSQCSALPHTGSSQKHSSNYRYTCRAAQVVGRLDLAGGELVCYPTELAVGFARRLPANGHITTSSRLSSS
jgi:hypothetical protein